VAVTVLLIGSLFCLLPGILAGEVAQSPAGTAARELLAALPLR
jgi:hypothetical protein